MKSINLTEFSNACQRTPQGKHAWDVLFIAALKYCRVTAKPSVDRSFGKAIAPEIEKEIAVMREKYYAALADLRLVAGQLGLEVPEFSVSDVCRLAV